MIAGSFVELLSRQWPIALLVVAVLYLARNYFNRGLNKYPGPLPAQLTDWFRFYKVWQRRPEQWHIKCHEKYGDVVRLGPNSLSFANPNAIKVIYGLGKGFTKSDFYPVQMATAKGQPLPTLFSTQSEHFHSQLKRSVNHAFSMSSQMQYEPFFDSTNEVFLDQTEKRFASTGDVCNFYRWLQWYTFDVIGDMVYSKRHGFLESNVDVDNIVRDNARLFDYAALIGQIPFLDKLWLKNPIRLWAAKHGIGEATFGVARFAKARLAERHPSGTTYSKENFAWEQTKDTPADLLSKFIDAKHERPDFFTDQLVTTMCVSMAFAGSEPAAVSLSGVFASLLRHPACMEKLMAELDDKSRAGHFHDNRQGLVTWTESQDLPYLDACINEAFRVHPAPGLPFERVVPEGGVDICGEFIKGGTIVGCNAWVIHRRTEVFGDDVEVYRPERWLVDETKDREQELARIRRMRNTMMQFGMGPRICLGKHIGLMEMYKLIPSVLRRFELQLEDSSKTPRFWNGWFVRPVDFRVKFQRRELVQPLLV
ncbi:cytochrome P450-like protein [Hypoxylon rubiginosum]|uniref:Cytochrome P450-like protein n=1 Tax=Hypoxylon rubiginosum TaxID=110542 RepID=A0ACC0DAR3_9PEZI|nr:cytochrome P450-like protein [Hypoxylon rubiginosum]